MLSKRTLSLRPSLSSGIPDRYTLIFTAPTISLRNTFPLADTCGGGLSFVNIGGGGRGGSMGFFLYVVVGGGGRYMG